LTWPLLPQALPPTTKAIAVLDRTKEPGATGEPMYQDVVTAVNEIHDLELIDGLGRIRIIGGRYGLSSKEFTPAMVKAVFDELSKAKPKNHFTIGIHDDVTHTSLEWDPASALWAATWSAPSSTASVPTVPLGPTKTPSKLSANTATATPRLLCLRLQKAGSVTVSHLRFGEKPIHAPVPHPVGRLCGLPPVQLPGAVRCAQAGRSWCHLPPQQPLWAR
jgi:pyruvate-ferredoxin/flavodoxin oxidoreductase